MPSQIRPVSPATTVRVAQRRPKLLSTDLGERRLEALPDRHRAGEHRDLPRAVDAHGRPTQMDRARCPPLPPAMPRPT